MIRKVPFNLPSIVGRELEFIENAVARGQLAGDGYYTSLAQEWLCRQTSAAATLLTHSCTAALELASILLDIGPGDEIIMPSFTFVSTANAVVLRGGVPVFVDVRPDTLNLDERLIESAITPRTRAVFVVHYAGVPVEMDAIRTIASRHGLAIVEDAAHALGARYKGRPAGSLGDMAAFSFHETKNIISGEGGALTLRDLTYLERAEIVREKGTNRRNFMRGHVDKYTWVDIGSSFLPGELIAAFLYGQFLCAETVQAERMANWQRYDTAFRGTIDALVGLPTIPGHCDHSAHLYYILLPSHAARGELIDRLRAEDIHAPFHYVPLHSSPAGRRYGRAPGPLMVTQDASARLLRLPLYANMGDAIWQVIDRVVHHVRQIA